MPWPFANPVTVTDPQLKELEALLRAGSTPQSLSFRARIVLRAAAADQPTHLQLAAEFDCDRKTVRKWRERFRVNGLSGLQDAPRCGRPPVFSPRGKAEHYRGGQQFARGA